MRCASYAVKPGDTLREQFPLSLFTGSRYSIEVYGPNGFHRWFTGDPGSRQVQVRTLYEEKGARVHLLNAGGDEVTATVQDNSYKTGKVTRRIGPGEETSVVLDLKRSYGWYDFTVKVNNSEAHARFAGRVEAGSASFSDPLMGGAADPRLRSG